MKCVVTVAIEHDLYEKAKKYTDKNDIYFSAFIANLITNYFEQMKGGKNK